MVTMSSPWFNAKEDLFMNMPSYSPPFGVLLVGPGIIAGESVPVLEHTRHIVCQGVQF